MASALSLPARVVLGFEDEPVSRLLALDSEREVVLSLVPLGVGSDVPPNDPGEIPPLRYETVPLSREEEDYPAMRTMHAATMLDSEAEVAAWRGPTRSTVFPSAAGRTVRLEPFTEAEAPQDPLDQVILRRGSTRTFARKSISFEQLSTMLSRATQGIPADFLEPAGAAMNDLYLIVHAVEGLPPGAYVFHRAEGVLECLKEGEFRAEAGHLGLDQELPADAGVTIFFLADLDPILERFGNRGYRAVQLEAGILGGKFYLAAYAQRLGATGLTFYDDEVTEFFSPSCEGQKRNFLNGIRHTGKTPVSSFRMK